MNKNQKGFGAIGSLLILVVIVIMGFAGWYVWQQQQEKAVDSINSFETCAAAGNPIMTSYPEQCSANGKTYANPKQTVR